MPLSFKSESHGNVAFGFFNIDSDMLLLDHYFFFADAFCANISAIAESENKNEYKISWQAYYIENPKDIGDLMGAIHGLRYTGFIGEVYRMYPFPVKPEDFKQKPEGHRNRKIVENIIQKYSEIIDIPLIYIKGQNVTIGPYRFNNYSFHELIKYVWKGGYPGWKDETRPDYVHNLGMKINENHNDLFEDLSFYF